MTNRIRFRDNIVSAVAAFNREIDSRKLEDFENWLDSDYIYRCNHNVPKVDELRIGGDGYKVYQCQECGELYTEKDKVLEQCIQCGSKLYWNEVKE